MNLFYNAIRMHERGPGAFPILAVAVLVALAIIAHYLWCGFTMPLAILTMIFVLSLLGFTMGHLHRRRKGSVGPKSEGLDESGIKELERFVRQHSK